jgi:hypothetical protein
MATIPVEAYVPWTDSLQYHLTRGDISLLQVEEFVVSEMNYPALCIKLRSESVERGDLPSPKGQFKNRPL